MDPGTHVVGYGVIEHADRNIRLITAGAIKTGKRTDPIQQRLAVAYRELKALIHDAKPDIIVLEQAFYGESVEAAIRLGEGRAMALLCAAQAKIPITEYTPATVKKSVTGHGTADKHRVASMVQAILRLQEPPTPVDATDALALAICHAHRESF